MNSELGKTEEELRLLVDEKITEMQRKLEEKDKILDSYRKEHGVLGVFFNELKDQISKLKPTPQIYTPSKDKKSVSSPCSCVMQVTDAHLGAVQVASEIEGFGEFSPEICEKRQMLFVEKVINWVNVHRAAYKIDELVMLITGDLISGSIHQELEVTNAYPAPVQTAEAGRILASQIAMIAPHFKSIRVEFIVDDNHGRLTKKPQCKEAGLNTFNYLVGFIAKQMTAKLSNVEFNIYPQYEKVVEVQGRRYLILHGHGILGFAGVPWYGWDRKVGKEATKRMNAADFNKFHKIIAGHFHTPICTQHYWLGGSVSGTDAFDHKCARHADPSQPAWLVHPVHGEFNRCDFNL